MAKDQKPNDGFDLAQGSAPSSPGANPAKKLSDADIDKILSADHTQAEHSAAPAALPPQLVLLWPYIKDLLVAYGLPMGIDALKQLRTYIAASNIHPLLKKVIVGALDSLVGNGDPAPHLGLS